VTTTHEQIQELLAGYVLRSLSGEDAAEADRILSDHVPGCPDCRATLDAFQVVTGDLGLDAPPVDPPDTLRARLRRELEPRGRSAGRAGRWNVRWSPGRIVAVAASVVLVAGAGGIALTRDGGGGLVNGRLERADIHDITNAAVESGASTKQIGGHATEIVSPATEKLYLYGSDVPAPPAGTVYRLWAGTPDHAVYVGDFLPNDDGMLLLEITLPVTSVGSLFVTIEPGGSQPTQPGDPAWPTAA
jgi:anti-sigma-K factor RskA